MAIQVSIGVKVSQDIFAGEALPPVVSHLLIQDNSHLLLQDESELLLNK